MGWALLQSGFWLQKGNLDLLGFLPLCILKAGVGCGGVGRGSGGGGRGACRSIIRGLFKISHLTDCNLPVSTNTMTTLPSPLFLGVWQLLKVSCLQSSLGSSYIA